MRHKPFSVTLDLWTLKSVGHILDLWGVCMKFHDDKCKGKAIMQVKPFHFSMHCDLDFLTPKSRGHILHSLGVFMWIFIDDRCKGKEIIQHKTIAVMNALCPWLLTFWPWNQEGISSIMQDKTFSIVNALWPWPFDPEFKRAHHPLFGGLYVNFHWR